MSLQETGESSTEAHKRFIDRPQVRYILLVWSLFGTALALADGVFTPAVSIVSALNGIGIARPDLDHAVAPLSVMIIVLLFFAESFSSFHVHSSKFLAPIVALWLLIIGASGKHSSLSTLTWLSPCFAGIYNITFHPGIFRAL